MKINPRHGRAAFTLIELMAVITIIVILAGLVVGGMGFVNERQAKEKAKVQMALLSKAIEEYKLDMGAYPGSTNDYGGSTASGKTGNYSKTLYVALFYEGYDYLKNPNRVDKKGTKAQKIYLSDLDPVASKQGWVDKPTSGNIPASTDIKDPWGNPYYYRVGTNAENPDFDLWTAGKNGDTNTNSASMTDAKNVDDIRNF